MSEQMIPIDAHAGAYQDGRSWAVNRATKQEVANLASYVAAFATQPIEYFGPHDQDAYSPAERFYFAIYPEHHGDRIGAADFWEDFFEMIGEVDRAYVEAFAAGAIA